MRNQDQHQGKMKYALIILAAILVISIVALVRNVSNQMNGGNTATVTPAKKDADPLKSVTAPAGPAKPISQDEMNSVSAPAANNGTNSSAVPQSVIDSLTAK